MKKEAFKKLYVGFITYNDLTAKYLPYFLDSLKNQTFTDYKIISVDHSDRQDNANTDFLRKNYPEIETDRPGKNLGFAGGYNRMIRKASGEGAGYFLALNPDMVLDKYCIERLIHSLEKDEKAAAVQPKILKWDFENRKKTDIVDGLGMFITRDHRFSDIGQGKKDNQEDRVVKEVFGFTGAAVLLRISALDDAAHIENGRKEYFDELMFMYKEDCDLSYRLRLAGYRVALAPGVIVYHHRTASPKGESNLKIAFNRLNKNRNLKKWSFRNHWILLLKVRNLPFSSGVKIRTLWYQIKSLVFILLFEQYLLKEFIELWKIRDEIRKRREQLKVRVDIREIERFME